jgi:DNA invertase Pin-like site-specific DNA recombinase
MSSREYRAVGYVRLSKASDGHGIEAQEKAISDFCSRRGLELVAIYTDDGASGRSMRKRPGLVSALESLERGDVGQIVSTRVDRLCRSSLDFHKIIERVQKAKGTILFSEQESFSLDSREGRMLATILAGFAEFEAALLSKRTSAALAVAKLNGKKLGNPQFKRVPEEVAMKIRAMRGQNMSLGEIADSLNESGTKTMQGGKVWHRSTVANILKRAEAA